MNTFHLENTFKEAVASVNKEYGKTMAPAKNAYDRGLAPAEKAYDEAMAPREVLRTGGSSRSTRPTVIRFDRHTCLAKACETDVAEFVASRMPEAPEPWRSADLVRAALRGRIAGA